MKAHAFVSVLRDSDEGVRPFSDPLQHAELTLEEFPLPVVGAASKAAIPLLKVALAAALFRCPVGGSEVD